jgi:diaminopimelate decarboxylase
MSLRTTLKRSLRPIVARSAAEAVALAPELWELERTPSGGLALGPHELAQLAATYGTPLHVCNGARLRANVEQLAGVELFYSYKTHPVPAILRRLHALGVGAEVISELELDLALRLGVPPERIIYNGPAKSDRSLRTAIERDILLLNLNHREELPRIAALAREAGRQVKLGIRVNSSAGWSWQFGTPMAGGEAVALFGEALATPEVSVEGLHSHRGVLIHDAAALEGFVDEVLAFADELHARFGWSPKILDLGGSLAIPTVKSLSSRDRRLSQTFGVEIGGPDVDRQLTLRAYAATIRARVTAHYARVGRALPRLVVELGRAVTGNAQLLLARVVTLRAGGDAPTMAILDAGINIAGILRGERHQVFRASAASSRELHSYRLVGPICQPGDVIVNAVRLPELAPGDVLAIMDSGAYFEPDSTVFSFARPGTLLVDGDELTVARRAETLDDVTARDAY